MKPIQSLIATSMLALFAAGTVSAQSTGTAPGGGTGKESTQAGTPGAAGNTGANRSQRADKAGKSTALNGDDVAFLKQAAQNGHAEVESSKLAADKAVSPQVKTFAKHMVEDHTKAGEELRALAASKGVEVPDGPSVAQKAKMKLLSTADGENFDRRYAESMGVEAHKDTIELFRKAASGANDPEVKAFAAKTLPTLQKHMKMAQELTASTERQSKGGADSGRTQASRDGKR